MGIMGNMKPMRYGREVIRVGERPLTEAGRYWLMLWSLQARLLVHNADGTIAWPKVEMRRK